MTEADNAQAMIRQFVTDVVKALVDAPDYVSVIALASDGNTIVLTINVKDGEAGKVIGKKGKTAEALRYITAAVAAKYGKRALVEIADTRGPKRVRSH